MSKLLRVSILATALLSFVPACAANAMNGTWALDAEASDDVDEAGHEFNRRMNELERERQSRRQKFDRDRRPRSGNKYDAQRIAAEEFIEEDYRSRDWDIPKDVRELVEAPLIKFYVGGKVAIKYGDAARRLLTINPAGRAFSVSGTKVTTDAVGRTLTWLEDEAVMVETSLHSGDKLVERYEVIDGGERLLLTIRFQLASRGPFLEFQRFYDRAD